MKTRALIIDHETDLLIVAAIDKARQHPTSLEAVKRQAHGIPQGLTIMLGDRRPGYKSEAQPQQVLIQQGYRAAISFEHQPPGLCAHLSVSVDTPGNLPSTQAVTMIAEAFGLEVPLVPETTTIWVEEYDPGHKAVNLVQVVKP